MKLTKEQVLSFLKDDITLADTSGMDLIYENIKQIDVDAVVYTLVILINDKYYKGVVEYYDDGGSFSEGDLTYKPGFYSDFDGMILKEVVPVETKFITWEEV